MTPAAEDALAGLLPFLWLEVWRAIGLVHFYHTVNEAPLDALADLLRAGYAIGETMSLMEAVVTADRTLPRRMRVAVQAKA